MPYVGHGVRLNVCFYERGKYQLPGFLRGTIFVFAMMYFLICSFENIVHQISSYTTAFAVTRRPLFEE